MNRSLQRSPKHLSVNSAFTALVSVLKNAGFDVVRCKITAHGVEVFPSRFGYFLWHVEFQQHHDGPASAAPLAGKATLPKFDGLTGIGMGGDLDDQGFPVKVVQFHRRPEQQVGVAEGKGHDEV